MEMIGKGELAKPTHMKWGVYESNDEKVMISRTFHKDIDGVTGHWDGYIEVPEEMADKYVENFNIAEITYFKEETDEGCGLKFHKHYPCGLMASEGYVVIGWDYDHGCRGDDHSLEDVKGDLARAIELLVTIRTFFLP